MKLNIPTFQTLSLRHYSITTDSVVFAVGKVAFIVSIFLAWDMGVRLNVYDTFEFPKPPDPITALQNSNSRPMDISAYGAITARNIFGNTPQQAKVEEDQKPKQDAAQLRLVATYTTKGQTPFAILESKDKKEQDVFDLNDRVFEAGKLTKVLAESVELTNDGEVVVLRLEDLSSASSGEGSDNSISQNEDGSEFTVSEDELSAALANLPKLLSQARAVPYFRNGKSMGMRLFAIQKGSLYEKLGLKNGDIIKSVNDNSLSDPSQALKIFNQLKDERSIYLAVERTGQEMDLRYSIE